MSMSKTDDAKIAFILVFTTRSNQSPIGKIMLANKYVSEQSGPETWIHVPDRMDLVEYAISQFDQVYLDKTEVTDRWYRQILKTKQIHSYRNLTFRFAPSEYDQAAIRLEEPGMLRRVIEHLKGEQVADDKTNH